MRTCLRIVAALSVFLASACLTSDVQITVKPDGSAHVERTVVVRPAALSEFERLTIPDAADRTTPDQLWAEILKRARDTHAFNRPVTPINGGDGMGLRMSYDVADVSGLDDIDLVPELPALGRLWTVLAQDHGASTRLRMSLDPIADGLQRLTVHFPRFRLDASAEPPSAWASGSAAEMAALHEVMRGARVTIAIATESPLVRTNSPFREGNRVTLVDADVAEALFSSDVRRMVSTPGSFDEMLSWFATVPGVTLAPDHEITLDFQNPSAPQHAVPSAAGSASTDTEIFVAPLIGSGSTLAIGAPIDISNNPGYDNQPSFSPDGEQLFFASTRGTAGPARDRVPPPPGSLPATDIYRYEIASRGIWRVTQTPESEFSPTVMPDGAHLSMIRVEADGTQHLCSVAPGAAAARETTIILPAVKPVGYHAWIDAKTVALYVLGAPGQPATLQIASIPEGSARTAATNIGRSLQRMPSGGISFVQHESAVDGTATAVVKELDPRSMETHALVKPAAGMTDPYVTWMSDGTALMASGANVYRWRRGDADWSLVARLDGFGLHDVTRLAVSPKGDRLAIVAQK